MNSLYQTSESFSSVRLLTLSTEFWSAITFSIFQSFRCPLRNKFQPWTVHFVATVACCCWHNMYSSGCSCFMGVAPFRLSSQKEVFWPSLTLILDLNYNKGHRFLIALHTVQLYGVLTTFVIHLSSIPYFAMTTSFQSIWCSWTNFHSHFNKRLWFCFLKSWCLGQIYPCSLSAPPI